MRRKSRCMNVLSKQGRYWDGHLLQIEHGDDDAECRPRLRRHLPAIIDDEEAAGKRRHRVGRAIIQQGEWCKTTSRPYGGHGVVAQPFRSRTSTATTPDLACRRCMASGRPDHAWLRAVRSEPAGRRSLPVPARPSLHAHAQRRSSGSRDLPRKCRRDLRSPSMAVACRV